MTLAVYSLTAWTGRDLVASRSTGELSAHAEAEAPVQLVGVRAGGCLILASRSGVLPFRIHPTPVSRLLHVLRCQTESDGLVSIRCPTTMRYLMVDGGGGAALTADLPQGWERFRLASLSSVMIDQRAYEMLTLAAETLGRIHENAPLSEIVSSRWPDVSVVLDSLLPVISTEQLDRMAASVLVGDLVGWGPAYSNDIWATEALPKLRERFFNAREASDVPSSRFTILSRWMGGRPAKPVERPTPARVADHVIGPAYDCLSWCGAQGNFASLPFALNARARARVQPTRDVCIVATARNEGIYLLEWLAYHRSIGIEAFYIYTNDNEDGSTELMRALAGAGVITLHESQIADPAANAQFKAYGHAANLSPATLDFRWALFIDADEFLVVDPSLGSDARAFADFHEQRSTDSVAINWNMMAPEMAGPTAGLLVSRNTRVCTRHEVGEGWRLVKSMSRPRRIIHSEAHVPVAEERSALVIRSATGAIHTWHNPPDGWGPSPKFADAVSTGVAVINHYFSKSPEEWMWKSARNRGDHALVRGEIPVITERLCWEFMLQMRGERLFVDERASILAGRTAAEIERLRTLPGVEEAAISVEAQYAARIETIRQTYRAKVQTSEWSDVARDFATLAGFV